MPPARNIFLVEMYKKKRKQNNNTDENKSSAARGGGGIGRTAGRMIRLYEAVNT